MANSKRQVVPDITCPKVSAFISYAHEDGKLVGQAKSVLTDVGIDAFLAHEDINVSEPWQARILQELRRCDLFVVLFSARFMSSHWGLQEVGFAVSRPDVLIVPLSLDETVPCGFVSRLQGRRVPKAASHERY